ncbi:MAG: hypothetical protein DHS20C20_15650 [Ardenticatenaceae bacterium]|nr:MAG: hypothetical protein DHS20C20_15650 [Ardenticatenaceae bacterium]
MYVKANKYLELSRAHIWLSVEQTTEKLLVDFQDIFCGLHTLAAELVKKVILQLVTQFSKLGFDLS